MVEVEILAKDCELMSVSEAQAVRYRHGRAQYHLKIGIRQRTWLAQTRLPFKSVVLFLFLCSHRGASEKSVNEWIGIQDEVALVFPAPVWSSNFRDLLVPHMVSQPLLDGLSERLT